MALNIQIGDTGTIIELELKNGSQIVDVSTATTQEIIFRKPDGATTLTKASSFTTDGTDGLIRYLSLAADFDIAGNWEMQGHIITPAGEWRTLIIKFKVVANLA